MIKIRDLKNILNSYDEDTIIAFREDSCCFTRGITDDVSIRYIDVCIDYAKENIDVIGEHVVVKKGAKYETRWCNEVIPPLQANNGGFKIEKRLLFCHSWGLDEQ